MALRARSAFPLVEDPSAQQPDVHRFEIAWRDRFPVQHAIAIAFVRRVRLSLEQDTGVHADRPMLEGALEDRAGGADLRQLFDAGEQAVDQVVPGGAAGKLLLVETVDREREDLRGIEPEVEIGQLRKAPQTEAGRDQEQERACDLHGDQHAARSSRMFIASKNPA